jgi:hypothetical protein
VTALAAAQLDAQLAERDVQLVMDGDDLPGRDLVKLAQRRHRPA